jgi:hypothetical protein
MRSAFLIVCVATILGVLASATSGSAQRGEWAWSPGLCKSNLKRFGVELTDGRTFKIADAFCVGRGGQSHCQWNSSYTKRLYDAFFVVVRSYDGVVRIANLYTTGEREYELDGIRVIGREASSRAFKTRAGNVTWRIARQEHEKGCANVPGQAPPASISPVSYDNFQSPTGNIRCAYVDQRGVGCITVNNGLGVVLRSFDRAYYVGRGELQLPPGRTLHYGQTWRVSSFRCASETEGMTCWSTVTNHGFFLSRDTRRIF